MEGVGLPDPLEVGIAVIRRPGEVLITQRFPGDSFGGYWEFPGGKIEAGETMVACVAREMREELGVEVAVEEPIGLIEHPYPERTIRMHAYLCRIVSSTPKALACADWQWVPPAALGDFSFPPASAPLIRWVQTGGAAPVPPLPAPANGGTR